MYLNKTGLWVFHSYFLLLGVHYRLDICLIFPSSFPFIPFRQVAPCFVVRGVVSRRALSVVNQWHRAHVAFIHPASLSDSEGFSNAFLSTWMGFCHFVPWVYEEYHPPFSFLLAFVNACLLARSRKQSSPIKNKTETKTKKKERHDTGFQLIVPSHVMIKVCDGYMKTPIVRGVLQGLYTEIHFWDPLRPALAS
ncbi:hypothetical protein BDV30DRAFT_83391 [Aspergillus minisclerotigenes]|uniref:Uncharacterized protein n=1 Tax=Aspergillus minisclerotigenes TaxID=656917 RepID=A0A5N6J843_9EURO|nr:hypothetical protein BDV30DRAFT_83391 [Aspergillus minisclerotigenes]